MSDDERKEYAQPSIMSGQPLYPWGLQITLDDESLKKLGLKTLPALDEVLEIKCKAQVISISSRKDGNEDDESSCQLQITEMEVIDKNVDTALKLYGDKK